jgi:hypothetical protein
VRPAQAAVNRAVNAPLGESADRPYPDGPPGYQARNAIDTSGSGTDQGQDTQGIAVPIPTDASVARIIQLGQAHLLKMLSDQGFDYSHPVDEYAPQGNPGPQQTLTVQPDYDMPERIESITVVIPVGATGASLQLGQRTIQLYSGAALTTPEVLTMEVRGIIINSDDPRIITFTGAVTSQPYLGLAGFALTRGQFS